jgi:putative RecB family exonuclease
VKSVSHLLLQEQEERAISNETPHLSYSRINRYLHCPEQYRLYYVERLRPKLSPAALVFGQVVHQALAHFFNRLGNPVEFFLAIWNEVKQHDVNYKQKESWEKLRSSGQGLLEKFCKEELHRFGQITAVEKPFELNITGLDLPFIGVIDLFAEVDGKRTLVDFKTSGSAYEDHEVILSDQLTAYQLAEPDVEQVALCALIKTKEPKIEWHLANRTGEQLTEYLAKAEYIGREILSHRFYKRPGRWCGYCDFLPVCVGDKQQTHETLIQIK